MALISLRLPADLTTLLNQEAKVSKRAKAEIARTAIADYLKKQERERFMAAYVKSAVGRDPTEALEMAEEFLPLENEALALNESGGRSRVLAAWESRSLYGAGRKAKAVPRQRRTTKRSKRSKR